MGGREKGAREAEGRGGKGNEVTKSTCEEEAEVEGRYGYGCGTRDGRDKGNKV